jgi:hypothetical protein
MMTAWLDNGLQALQLKETLLAAGFTAKEISILSPAPLGLTSSDLNLPMVVTRIQRENADQGTCCLIVQTQTHLDEDLAKAVFRDCGISPQKADVRPTQGSFNVSLGKPAKDRVLRS